MGEADWLRSDSLEAARPVFGQGGIGFVHSFRVPGRGGGPVSDWGDHRKGNKSYAKPRFYGEIYPKSPQGAPAQAFWKNPSAKADFPTVYGEIRLQNAGKITARQSSRP